MSRKNHTDPETAKAAREPAPDAVPDEDARLDLKALIQAVKRRDRQLVIARVLVNEFARADGEDTDLAWRRFRRAAAIGRVSALKKGQLSSTDLPGLVAEVVRLSGAE